MEWMTSFTFAWRITTGWWGPQQVRSLLAAARDLNWPANGTLRTGDWLGIRPEARNTQLCITATFLEVDPDGLNLLDSSRWDPKDGLYLVNWDGLLTSQAVALHHQLLAHPDYVGVRSLDESSTGAMAFLLLRDNLNFRLRLISGSIILPCTQEMHQAMVPDAPLTPHCAADRAWVDTFQGTGLPLSVAHAAVY